MTNDCQENRPVVYLDETWANAHNCKDCAWVERYHVTGENLVALKGLLGRAIQDSGEIG